MELDILNDKVWRVAPELERGVTEEIAKPNRMPTGFVDNDRENPTVGEVARKHRWKVGRKEARIIGHGDIPNHPVEVNGWIVMRATDFKRIVPQEAIDRVLILMDEGVEIKGLLIADDLKKQKVEQFRNTVSSAIMQGRSFAEQNLRNVQVRATSTASSVTSAINNFIVGEVKPKVNDIDLTEVKKVVEKGFEGTAKVGLFAAGAVASLPLLAILALPVALLSLDPWLLVVDSKSQWWVISEWWE